jgi:hypothetical protein
LWSSSSSFSSSLSRCTTPPGGGSRGDPEQGHVEQAGVEMLAKELCVRPAAAVAGDGGEAASQGARVLAGRKPTKLPRYVGTSLLR